jgi:hypothetical protein
MTAKQRIKNLEKTSGAVGGDNTFRVFIVTPDGGAWTSDAAGKRTEYTAAEYAELQKQSVARGDNIIRVIPASMDGDQ